MQIEDGTGNITLDRAEDATLPLTWKDDAGTPINLSTADLKLKVRGQPAQTLIPTIDAQDENMRLFEFSREWALALGSKPREYWVELTHPDGKVDVLWRATIAAEGYVA